jgi:hypothetical protein
LFFAGGGSTVGGGGGGPRGGVEVLDGEISHFWWVARFKFG